MTFLIEPGSLSATFPVNGANGVNGESASAVPVTSEMAR
jgi:hypothetical protein